MAAGGLRACKRLAAAPQHTGLSLLEVVEVVLVEAL